MKRFNGYYSCWYCLERGIHKDRRHLYPDPVIGDLRTGQHFLDAFAAIADDSSVADDLPGFLVSWQMVLCGL